MTVLLTIVSGVCVYIVGQYILKIYIEPAQQLRRTIGEISYALTFYANVYSNAPSLIEEKCKDAANKLRNLSAQLMSDMYMIPFYSFTRLITMIPEKRKIEIAKKRLIELSNHTLNLWRQGDVDGKEISRHMGYTMDCREAISEALGIYRPNNERIDPGTIKKMINGKQAVSEEGFVENNSKNA